MNANEEQPKDKGKVSYQWCTECGRGAGSPSCQQCMRDYERRLVKPFWKPKEAK
jgi:hypothetical protein